MPKRWLLFSDLHADLTQARSIVERSRDCDLVIGAGDLGNLRRNLAETIDVLSKIHCPALFVAGNNETTDELREACRTWPAAHVLHGNGVTIDGQPFWGLGGGVPTTPFGDWSYDLTEEEASDLLAGCPPQAVLVTHSPPYGILDRSSQGKNLGSRSVLAAIRKRSPPLVVCGHIHASSGQRAIVDDTTVINAGPLGLEWVSL